MKSRFWTFDPGDIISSQDIKADGEIWAWGNGGCNAHLGGSCGVSALYPGLREGRLAEYNHGVWGGLVGGIQGYLGGNNYGVYGSGGVNPTSGYIAGPNNAVFGESTGDIHGYLGGTRGAYGQYNSGIFGYFYLRRVLS